MKFILLPLVFLSFNLFSGFTFFDDDLDEFSDKREIYLGLVGDEHNNFLNELIAIYCDTEDRPKIVIKKGIIISINSYLTVKLRFDKNESISKRFSTSSDSRLFTKDADFIKLFLEQLRSSNDLIVKIEGETGIMRFSDLVDSEKHFAEFKNAASEMSASCNIF